MTTNQRTQKRLGRQQKEQALSQLLQGKPEAVKALQPPMTLDLDQFTTDELERFRLLQESVPEAERNQWDLARLEVFFGRSLKVIPYVTPTTF